MTAKKGAPPSKSASASLVLKQLILKNFNKNELFWIKLILLNIRTTSNYKKTWTLFCTAVFCETLQNFKENGPAVLVLALGEHGNF